MFDETGQISPHNTHPDSERKVQPTVRESPLKSYADWIRGVAKKFNIDGQKMILGCVLNTFRDDRNIFSWEVTLDQNPSSDEKKDAQAKIQESLNWQIDCPQLPKEFRRRLIPILEDVKRGDWSNESQYQRAYNNWNKVNKWITGTIKINPRYEDAITYYIDKNTILKPEYDKVLGSSNM